jgi:molybdopterin molybdotransferase/putative molybdopterin biosynthesis protein
MTRIRAQTSGSGGETVRRARIARGLTQSALAREANVSRQALSAIEAGAYQPSVAVALAIARALDRSVESLFAPAGVVERVRATLDSGRRREGAAPQAIRQPVALGRVADKIVAMRQTPADLRLSVASGVVERFAGRLATVAALRSRAEIDSALLLAGCDPAAALLGDWLARHHAPVTCFASRCSSRRALAMLRDGRVHGAGIHVRDPRSGEYNLALARHALGHGRAVLVNFARWELGLGALRDSPAARGVANLADRRVRLVNREPGSGARIVLDEILAQLKIDPAKIHGYDREVAGHLEVAAAIAQGEANVGVTIRLAAEAYGLSFIPLREERYDLVVPERELDAVPVKAMMETLNSTQFARELSTFCGYDTSQTGALIAKIG